ncbi:hypothetical protein IWQ60_005901 [Tieghemiomyces parasiticus]|uniref:Uncharacterized protein n=1 Tax=Tieghemiomyces parasiticus TaxID=78921 RepID=A0A9W8A902_9FUNG|nr:hypothetical protein IWQ60_005901 [Tieghemiomyces parasiticus]
MNSNPDTASRKPTDRVDPLLEFSQLANQFIEDASLLDRHKANRNICTTLRKIAENTSLDRVTAFDMMFETLDTDFKTTQPLQDLFHATYINLHTAFASVPNFWTTIDAQETGQWPADDVAALSERLVAGRMSSFTTKHILVLAELPKAAARFNDTMYVYQWHFDHGEDWIKKAGIAFDPRSLKIPDFETFTCTVFHQGMAPAIGSDAQEERLYATWGNYGITRGEANDRNDANTELFRNYISDHKSLYKSQARRQYVMELYEEIQPKIIRLIKLAWFVDGYWEALLSAVSNNGDQAAMARLHSMINSVRPKSSSASLPPQ